MPQVPEYGGPKVRAAAAPGARQSIQITQDDFGGMQARTMQQQGAQLSRDADILSRRVIQRQEEDNELAAWNAFTKLSEQERSYLYDPDKGLFNQKGSGAMGAASRAAKDIGGMAQQLMGTLENDDAKQKFQRLYQSRLDSTLDSLAKFEATERNTYKQQVAQGVVMSAQQDAATRWNDPTYIENSAELAVTAMRGNLLSQGTAPELVEAQTKAMRSSVWAAAIQRGADANPIAAKSLLDANRDKMTGEDVAKLEKVLEAPYRAARASAIAGQVNVQGTGFDALVSAVLSKESGGRRYDKDGNLLTSPKGAEGEMQVMPGTQKDPGFGVTPAKDDSPEEKARVGRDYLAAMMNRYGGNKTLALAAYNAGPDRVDGWLKTKGDPRTGGVSDAEWAASIPIAETRDYVQTITAKVSNVQNNGMSLRDRLDAAKALAGDDPELQQAAVAQVTQQYNLQEAAKRDEQDAALEQVYAHVLQTGGYAGVPAETLAKLDKKTLVALQDKARDVKTDWAFYDTYMGLSPAEKAATPLQLMMTKLGPEELKAAIKERNEAKTGNSKAPWLQERATILKGFATEAGIVPAGEKMNEKEQARYNALSSYMNQKMEAFRISTGKEMNEAEFRDEAARAVTKVVTKRGVISDDTANVFELNGQPILTVSSVKDVPAYVRSDIEKALRSRGKEVTDAVVLLLARAFIDGDQKAAKAILDGAK